MELGRLGSFVLAQLTPAAQPQAYGYSVTLYICDSSNITWHIPSYSKNVTGVNTALKCVCATTTNRNFHISTKQYTSRSPGVEPYFQQQQSYIWSGPYWVLSFVPFPFLKDTNWYSSHNPSLFCQSFLGSTYRLFLGDSMQIPHRWHRNLVKTPWARLLQITMKSNRTG